MILFQKDEAQFENLDERRLCLSFINTNDWHLSEQPVETLNSYADLIKWARTVNLITSNEADHLLVRSKQDQMQALHTLDKAIALRETVFRLFHAQATQKRYDQADLDSLNEVMCESLEHLRLLPLGKGFSWGWVADPVDLDIILWPVVSSTVVLMASKELAYVKFCEDDRGCGWAFLDTSRNHNRRWCSMDSCGNRAKAQRHYQRVTVS